MTLYRKASLPSSPAWKDSITRFGYNPAIEARPITAAQVQKVMSARGSLLGTRDQLKPEVLVKFSSAKL